MIGQTEPLDAGELCRAAGQRAVVSQVVIADRADVVGVWGGTANCRHSRAHFIKLSLNVRRFDPPYRPESGNLRPIQNIAVRHNELGLDLLDDLKQRLIGDRLADTGPPMAIAEYDRRTCKAVYSQAWIVVVGRCASIAPALVVGVARR